jgi:L-histidine N-alpha-methyltransferase
MATAPVMATLRSAVETRSQPWSLCLVGEDVERKLQDLIADLTRSTSTTGDGKRITSGFAYWGVEPTFAWAQTCTDPLYPVMKESIESFTSGWYEIHPNLARERHHYVSFGPGTGQKDATIIRDLMRRNPQLCYVPVDMSAEMLRLAIRGPIRQTGLPADRILPVQMDFSSPTNLAALWTLLRNLAGDEPILFSLLGNTLANFDDDSELLSTLTAGLRPQDRLVLEAATADRLDDELATAAAREYRQSRSFCEFATSALLRHTNLRIDDTDALVFHGAVESERSLLVKVMYQNQTGQPIRFTLLPNRTTGWLPAKDTIRLYLTRKYVTAGLKAILSSCNLVEQAATHSYSVGDRARPSFGMSLMLVAPGTRHESPHSSADDLWA